MDLVSILCSSLLLVLSGEKMDLVSLVLTTYNPTWRKDGPGIPGFLLLLVLPEELLVLLSAVAHQFPALPGELWAL